MDDFNMRGMDPSYNHTQVPVKDPLQVGFCLGSDNQHSVFFGPVASVTSSLHSIPPLFYLSSLQYANYRIALFAGDFVEDIEIEVRGKDKNRSEWGLPPCVSQIFLANRVWVFVFFVS